GAVLAVAYAARVLREVWSGDRTAPAIADVRGTSAVLVWVLVVAIVVLGVYPVALLELTDPAVSQLVGGAAAEGCRDVLARSGRPRTGPRARCRGPARPGAGRRVAAGPRGRPPGRGGRRARPRPGGDGPRSGAVAGRPQDQLLPSGGRLSLRRRHGVLRAAVPGSRRRRRGARAGLAGLGVRRAGHGGHRGPGGAAALGHGGCRGRRRGT